MSDEALIRRLYARQVGDDSPLVQLAYKPRSARIYLGLVLLGCLFPLVLLLEDFEGDPLAYKIIVFTFCIGLGLLCLAGFLLALPLAFKRGIGFEAYAGGFTTPIFSDAFIPWEEVAKMFYPTQVKPGQSGSYTIHLHQPDRVMPLYPRWARIVFWAINNETSLALKSRIIVLPFLDMSGREHIVHHALLAYYGYASPYADDAEANTTPPQRLH